MFKNLSIFSKIMIIVCILLIPLLLLFAYSNYVSTNVVKSEIEKSNVNRLSFFLNQMDTNADQLSKAAFTLGREPEAVKFQSIQLFHDLFDSIQIRQTLLEKIKLQSTSYSWMNKLSIYSPALNQLVSTDALENYDLNYFQKYTSPDWVYRPQVKPSDHPSYFYRYSTEPSLLFGALNDVNVIIEVGFAARNIELMLDQFKTGSIGEPFFFNKEYNPIMNSTANRQTVQALSMLLQGEPLLHSGSKAVEINEVKYMLSYAKSGTLDWYLVDVVPLENVLAPITTSRNLFYTTISMLLLTSIMASYLLFKNVQVPITRLIASVNNLKRGNFSTRLTQKASREFTILFNHFNSMAEQIQDLVEKVLREKIRARDATLKQLQSQINPHFLYNCLAFIQSMAQLENKQAIIAMTQHLSKYYRYATRIEQQEVTMENELNLIVSYLEIHKMQTLRLDYGIDVPDELKASLIPRLLVQPIVENAIVHGVECKSGIGTIMVSGYVTEAEHFLVIEDNGIGTSAEDIAKLNEKFAQELDAELGHGMWNVHQRLRHQFGGNSGLHVSASLLGGWKVTLRMDKSIV
ncbi:sensor histidine kinase [Paenibacillus agricola]|uniref:Histidine kinase n=1 Tax=Paenibacillus agricola TaxID=2716264 RepID=A0ABX0JIC4_9BACL|nr:histidine kinase [Paenibacillus agricola]NHN34194.1 histidine kinase [Paenibacillus agricola]